MWDLLNYKKNIAVITDTDISYTYEELYHEQNEFAKQIEGRCLIFILCTNTLACLNGYISCIMNGIVPLMLDVKTHDDMIDNLINIYKPRYLWMPEDKYINSYELEVYRKNGYRLIKTNEDYNHELFEDMALLLTTSGSTGSSKLVRQSYKNLLSNTKSIVEYLELDSKEKAITILPMFYTYGLSIINTHLFCGGTILLTSKKIIDRKFWGFFHQYEGTSISGVPYTYEVLKILNFHKMNLPTLRTITQAGGKLLNDVHSYFVDYAHSTDKKFIVMYGQTEATARISYLPYDQISEKAGSIGIPIPGGEIFLVDNEDRIISEAYEEGEIVYKGDNVTLGYATDLKDLKKGDERKGIINTGDIGYRDKDGFYFIKGRIDRYVKLMGNRINLDEMENLLNKHYPDETFVCLNDSINHITVFTQANIDFIQLIKYIAGIMNLNESLFSVIKVDQIDRKSNGKIDYRLVEQKYLVK